MAYYLISFYFLGNVYLVRIAYSIMLGLETDLTPTLVLELLPNTLVFAICSLMTYCW
jgi:hypothetical protein